MKWNSIISEKYGISNSVKQGPLLFYLVFTWIIRLNVLKTVTLAGLKCMLAICENYSDEYEILFNASKSQLLHFTNSNTEEKITLEINNNKIIESILNVYVLESTTRLYIDIMICHLQFVILIGKSTNYLLFFIC